MIRIQEKLKIKFYKLNFDFLNQTVQMSVFYCVARDQNLRQFGPGVQGSRCSLSDLTSKPANRDYYFIYIANSITPLRSIQLSRTPCRISINYLVF